MPTINTKPLSGFLELTPNEQIEFDNIKNIIEKVYNKYGFTSLDTPLVERSEVLLAKGGTEADKQIYFVQNGIVGGEKNDQALRFDLTVPLARYTAEHFDKLSFPFKRCHLNRVYRGERAQKGRFREFYQCDIDVIGRGSLSINYDAEVVAVIYDIFRQLDFGKFTIRISNRKLYNGLFEALAIETDFLQVLSIIDKVEKISPAAFLEELKSLKLTQIQIDKITSFMNIKGDYNQIFDELLALDIDNAIYAEGLEELKKVTSLLTLMGVEQDYFKIDLNIVRGLDYYTGTIFETTLDNSPIGSVCSGGRYDDLASSYTKEKLPGVGISIGLSRLFWQLKEHGYITHKKQTIADIIVVPDRDSNLELAIKTATILRENGLKVDLLLEEFNIKKKLNYLDKKETPFAVIVKTTKEDIDVISLQYKQGNDIIKEELDLDSLTSRIKELRKH